MGQQLLLHQDPPTIEQLRLRLDLLPPVRWWRRWRRPLAADAYLLSYPKTGRTWVRVMIGQLLAEHYGHPELAQVELGPRLPRFAGVPRVVAKHDGSPHLRSAAEFNADRSEFAACRVILLVRDLRDTAVSNYFHVTRRTRRFEGDLSSYLRCPRGSVDSMLRYYNAWGAQRRVPRQLLLLRYEDLQRDTAHELRRVAAFLGLGNVGEPTLASAVEYGSFGAMRSREAVRPADGGALSPGAADDTESFKSRRGRVGGFVDYLSPADIEWFNGRIDTELDPFYGYSAAVWPAAPGA